MSLYHLFFENSDIRGHLSTGPYDNKRNIYFDIFHGDEAAAAEDIPKGMENIMLLYRKLKLNEVKECMLMVLAQVSAVAVIAGIDDWEISRIKQSYYLGIENSTLLSDLEHLNYEFFYDFVRVVAAHNTDRTYSPFVRDIQRFIRKNIEEKLTLLVLADEFHCSTSTVAHRFKKETGVTVNEYILLQKIAVAKPMIRQHIPISQIAAQLNFSSQSHFTGTFRKITGKSPLDWKKNP